MKSFRKNTHHLSTKVIKGIVHIHPRGFGFVTPEDKSEFREDIFIPKHKTAFAVDGDFVEAEVFLEQLSAKGYEGTILSILKRGRRHVAGTIIEIGKAKNKSFAYIPLLGPEREMTIVPKKGIEFNVGDRVMIEVSEWGSPTKPAKGSVCAIIGHILDPSVDIRAAIEEFELTDTFSQDIDREIAKFGLKITAKDLKNRVDLTKEECFTIDPDESKDFDDAIGLIKNKEGFLLSVHIADVSHYVKPGTYLDKEAALRCNSVYFPGGVLPMLPHKLSSHLCSLMPNVKRLAVSVQIQLDEEGEVISSKVQRSVIRSQKRFTYKEAKQVLDGKLKSKHKNTLLLMEKLCYLLKAKRAKRGAVEFAMPDLRLLTNEKGYVTEMQIVEYDISHQIVEEFMLKANEVIAILLSEQQKPLTYRIHEEPKKENLEEFASYARAFGFKLPSKFTPEQLQNLFDEIRQSPYGKCLTTAFIRSMKLASYSTQNVGHYGLQLEHYTHFTSPIRRYVDLIVHRLLFEEVDPSIDWEAVAERCSEQERLSAKAESSVIQLKKLRYLDELCQQEHGRTFAATLTAIKPFGLIFEVNALFLEGFIPLHELEHASYHKRSSKIISKKKKEPLTAGQEIFVRPIAIDLTRRRVDWKLAKK